MGTTPLIIGHRGNSSQLPENTLAAFALAFKQGAGMIEFDVHTSRDGVPVIIHDSRLERTTGGSGYVAGKTAAELGRADAGFAFDPENRGRFPERGKGHFVPTLAQIFETFPDRALAIEIKERSVRLVDQVMAMVESQKASGRCIVGSKYGTVSKRLREQYPGTRRFLSRTEILSHFFCFQNGRPIARDPGAVASMPVRQCNLPFDSERFIEALHAAGIAVFYWTVNTPSVMETLAARGADGIITDLPDLAHRVLERQAPK